MLLSIKRSSVPSYLQQSEFYLSLSEEDEGEISIPEECFKFNAEVSDEQSLRCLLSTLRFWGVNEILDEIYRASQEQLFFAMVIEDFVAEFKYLPVLRDIRRGNAVDLTGKLQVAVCAGSVETLKYLIERFYIVNPYTKYSIESALCLLAATCGQLSCLKYFHSLRFAWDHQACQAAASKGHLDCLMFLHENGCNWYERQMARFAVRGGVECLRYVVERGCRVSEFTYEEAAHVDSGACCEYLYSLGVPWPDTYGYLATQYNAVECLRCALSHGCPYSTTSLSTLFSIECIQVLHEFNVLTPAHIRQCSGTVARSGNYLKFKFIHDLGYPFDDEILVKCLAYTKHIQCFVYMHESGYVLSHSTAWCAIRSQNTLALRYMYDNGVIFTDISIPRYELRWITTSVLQFLHELGCIYDKNTVRDAVIVNKLDFVKYLVESGCPVPSDICGVAATGNKLEILRYLHSKGYPLKRIKRTPYNISCVYYINEHIPSNSCVIQ